MNAALTFIAGQPASALLVAAGSPAVVTLLCESAFPRLSAASPLPFLDRPLSFHCLSSTFRCPFTAIP